MIPKIICWLFGHKRWVSRDEYDGYTYWFKAFECERCGEKLK